MRRVDLTRHGKALALMAPLFCFLLAFFVWPLASVMSEAVSDQVIGRTLPITVRAIAPWDRITPPTDLMKGALTEDLRQLTDKQALGDLVRRLNSAQAGFRTLMMKTTRALEQSDGPIILAEIDARWAEPAYWRAIAEAAAPYTDRHLLAAVDLTRDAGGEIVAMPADSSAHRAILGRTFWVAALVTLTSLAIGLPYAMLAASVTGWKRQALLGAVLLPLWTSLLVRTAAWYILLQEQGLVNDLLRTLHLIDGPVPLIFNRLGVVIAMTHVLLPFMVLPIYSVLLSVPRTLMPAAASLGAGPIRAFLRVLLPLSLRGVASGGLLVFMAAIGYYITPALIGGAQDQMISSVIAFYATGSANWNMAAALGLVLLVATLALYAVYGWLSTDRAVRG